MVKLTYGLVASSVVLASAINNHEWKNSKMLRVEKEAAMQLTGLGGLRLESMMDAFRSDPWESGFGCNANTIDWAYCDGDPNEREHRSHYNNLGGKGPDFDRPQEFRVEKVANVNGQDLDLVAATIGHYEHLQSEHWGDFNGTVNGKLSTGMNLGMCMNFFLMPCDEVVRLQIGLKLHKSNEFFHFTGSKRAVLPVMLHEDYHHTEYLQFESNLTFLEVGSSLEKNTDLRRVTAKNNATDVDDFKVLAGIGPNKIDSRAVWEITYKTTCVQGGNRIKPWVIIPPGLVCKNVAKATNTTATPKAEAPKAEAPKAEAPKDEAAKDEAAKDEAAKAEATKEKATKEKVTTAAATMVETTTTTTTTTPQPKKQSSMR